MRIKGYILFTFLLCANLLFAQDTKFTASASKTQVGTGEQFVITFSISGRADSFSPPDFSGFEAQGPNQSTEMTMANGVTVINSSYSYILVPTKMGSFTIGPA